MRIALLSHLASPSVPTGAERSLALLAAGLERRGHDVLVVVPGAGALEDDLRRAGVAVRQVATRPLWLTYHRPRSALSAAVRWMRWRRPGGGGSGLSRLLADWRPDAVHVNCLPHLSGAGAARRTGAPTVWHIREILPAGWRRRFWARQLRHVDRVVAVSRAVARWLEAEGLGDRVRVVHNGVAVEPTGADRGQARARLDLAPDGILIGLVGQLVPHKGAGDFVEAAQRALRERPDLRFVIAGAGPDGFRRDVARRIGGDQRIRLLAPQPDPSMLYRAIDAVCLATRTPDPLPRSVLEAMAHGRAVVAVRTGGAEEMVRDGQTGLMVEPGDVGALSRAFVRLARSPDTLPEMGRAGREVAAAEFSIERHVDGMQAVFSEIAR